MTILEKLHKIQEEKCIYNIHYCNAGVGFVFYYPEKGSSYKDGLSVEDYHPTFEKAVEIEYERLESNQETADITGEKASVIEI
jgi:hypothetical protein